MPLPQSSSHYPYSFTNMTSQQLSSRAALGLSFGTKKSQKAIRALTENAIGPRKPTTITPNGTSSPASSSQPLDPLAAAVVESMASTTSTMPTREELQSAVDDAKPRPKPNLQATTPAEVYPVPVLVGGEETLRALAVKDWQDAVSANKPVHTKSRFVSNRLVKVAQSGDVKNLKTLRYLLLLLDFHGCLKPGARGVKKVPQKDEMRKAMSNASEGMTEGVRRRFADAKYVPHPTPSIQSSHSPILKVIDKDREADQILIYNSVLNKWHTDNLYTHIFALALTIDNFDLDIYDLREDLKLENKEYLSPSLPCPPLPSSVPPLRLLPQLLPYLPSIYHSLPFLPTASQTPH